MCDWVTEAIHNGIIQWSMSFWDCSLWVCFRLGVVEHLCDVSIIVPIVILKQDVKVH